MSRAFVTVAAWWTADAGPPRAELIPRFARADAGFVSRALAHVLGHLAEPAALGQMPWVLGVAGPGVPPLGSSSVLRRAIDPEHGLSVVQAGRATVAMAFVEGFGFLDEHSSVLVAFAQDATPPYSETLAAALVLSREPTPGARLVLSPPQLHRTPSHSPSSEPRIPTIEAAVRLARAVDVGRPTVETIPSGRPEGGEFWRIELHGAL